MADTSEPTLDAVLAAFGFKMTNVGAGTTLIAWLLSSQGAALVGIVGVVGGLSMQWYFKRRQDRREQEEHEFRMRAGKV